MWAYCVPITEIWESRPAPTASHAQKRKISNLEHSFYFITKAKHRSYLTISKYKSTSITINIGT